MHSGLASSVGDDGAAHVGAAALALHEGGLALEDGEGLLEALDLGRAARLALLVALRLCDAAVLATVTINTINTINTISTMNTINTIITITTITINAIIKIYS